MMIIGICGSSGSGKSTLCSYFHKKGFKVLDCDNIYSNVITPPSACLDEIVSFFGKEILSVNGSLNRKALADIVFSSEDKLKALNSITFKHIKKQIFNTIELCKDEKLIFIDAPLLFESGIDKICNKTLCVIAPYSQKLKRLSLRDKIKEKALKKRLDSQLKDDFLYKNCDDAIINDSDIESLYLKAETYLNKVLKQKDENI